MRVRLLSRASDLARLQALLVGRAIAARWPDADISYVTRTSAGDRDTETPLAALPNKGAFTTDLTDMLLQGAADAVVHSWKDLPLEGRPDTTIAATLERADPRDVLLVRRDVVTSARPSTLRILSSSPRRVWLLEHTLPSLLPWRADRLEFQPVRGNIQTRLTRLVEGRGDALVVAKAALDRLLGFGPPFEAAAASVRAALAQTRWMVLPTREVPGAPAQGAVAVEVAGANRAVVDLFGRINHEPTWRAVLKERDVLAAFGGGCHEAVGATVLPREYGRIVSVRARANGKHDEGWSLVDAGVSPPRTDERHIWPRPDERHHARREPLDVAQPSDDGGFWIARANALPEDWTISPDRIVWAAGPTTWRKLAARGIWVNGSADGLGDSEPPRADWLAGRSIRWHRLTHRGVDDPQALPTYTVDERLPDDLPSRSHFFWTSGSLFRRALATWPELAGRWHGSGPGRTWQTLRDVLGPTERVRAWLDYEDWHREVMG